MKCRSTLYLPTPTHIKCIHESHACRVKTSILLIEGNFSRLTHKSGRVVIKKNFISFQICYVLFIYSLYLRFQMSTIRSNRVQMLSEYLWNFGNVRKSSEIFGSGSDVFGNPGHDDTEIHAFDSEKVGGYEVMT